MCTIYTIGHSTRPQQEFLDILQAFSIRKLVDIRTVPRSRRNPQYEQSVLGKWLADDGIEYLHDPALGGLRHPRKDSVNMGWKNASFRGYADYMQSSGFESAINGLITVAESQRIVIMCAEAVPWRCHRSLVADALLVRGIAVQHIMTARVAKPHTLTSWAHVDGLRITYPTPESAEP